jgi:hypothetical protein
MLPRSASRAHSPTQAHKKLTDFLDLSDMQELYRTSKARVLQWCDIPPHNCSEYNQELGGVLTLAYVAVDHAGLYDSRW